MKNVRRILAMILVVLLAGNCFISVQASPEEEGTVLTDVSESTLDGETEVTEEVENETEEGNGEGEEKISLLIQLEELESELKDMEFVYGSTPIGSMEFESDALKCKDEDDELPEDVSLSLIADIQYICTETDEEIANKTSSSYTQAGKYNLELSNFRLSGDNAEEYLLEVETDYIYAKENVTVKQKLIKIEPASTTVEYHGQYLSGTADYSDQILPGDTVDISATYAYRSVNRIITLESCTCSNSNYKVELKADMRVEYEKTNYTIDVKAKDENPQVRYETIEEEGESREYAIYEGIEEFNLVAPDGYLISFGGTIEAGWSAKRTERLSNNSEDIQYYLRNNDSTSSNYGAIGQQNVYRYKVFNDAPTDMKAYIIAGNYYNSTEAVYLNSDTDTKIFLEVTGEEIIQPISFYWEETKDGNTLVNFAEGTDITSEKQDGKYVYKYSIDIVSEMQYSNFYASNTNTNGSCDKVKKFKINNQDAKSSKVIIDKVAPLINNFVIGSFDRKVQATFDIEEFGSGIKSIEYGWDIDEEYNDKERNDAVQNKNVGFKGNNYTTNLIELSDKKVESQREYYGAKDIKNVTIELPWDDSVYAKEDKHRLTLRITDILGNKWEYVYIDGIGTDRLLPQIKSVEIKQNPNAAEGAVLNIKNYGTFSNAQVDVIFDVQDNTDGNVVSGIKQVRLYDQSQSSSEDKKLNPELGTASLEQYTYTFNTGIYDNLKAEVWDCQNNYFSATIADISENKYSNTLVVDAAAPKWELKYNDVTDDNYEVKKIDTVEQRWYGLDDKDALLYYHITDELSGLEGYLIAEGYEGDTVSGTDLYVRTNEIIRDVYKEFKIEDLGNGKHVFSLFAKDNASNLFVPGTDGQSVNEYAFAKDIRYVDLENPSGNVEVSVDGIEIGIDNNGMTSWISGTSDVRIKVDATDGVSGVKAVEYIIYSADGTQLAYELYGPEPTQISENLNGSSVTFAPSFPHEIMADHTQVYICISITDFAGNRVRLSDIILCRDLSVPEIDKFYLIPSDNEEEVVNSYPMGICANQKVKLGVVAHDAPGDSGVNCVRLYYTQASNENEDEAAPIYSVSLFDRVDQEEKDGTVYGKYEIELTLSEENVFRDWKVYAVAFDNINNESDSDGKLISVDDKGNPTDRIILENIKPDAKIELLDPKYVNEADGTNWYDGTGGIAKITVSDAQSGLSQSSLSISLNNEEKEITANELGDQNAIIRTPLKAADVNAPDRTEYSGELNLIDLSKKFNKTSKPNNKEESDSEHGKEDDKEENEDKEQDKEDNKVENSEESTDIPNKENITGEYTLKYSATDNAGNVADVEQKYNIDDTAPCFTKITLNFEEKGEKIKSDFSTSDNLYKKYRRTPISMEVQFDDPGVSSGIATIAYEYEVYVFERNTNKGRIESGAGYPIKVDVTSLADESFTIDLMEMFGNLDINKKPTYNFRGFIRLKIVDNVGNTAYTQIVNVYNDEKFVQDLDGFMYDTTPIVINIPSLPDVKCRDENGNKLFTEDVKINVSISDATSGISQLREGIFDENNTPDMNDRLDKQIAPMHGIYEEGHEVNGWRIVEADRNLPLMITKSFNFSDEGNDIHLAVRGTDNAGNISITNSSETFSIDKTAPVATVTFREDNDDDLYYNADRIADINIKERNFDASRMTAAITNTFGDIPSVTYTKKSKDEYTATIVFDEGDYTFDYSGTDRANHQAKVTFAGGNEKKFYVDKTNPVITDNFATFVNAPTKNNFNTDKVARITIEEHNFSPELVNITVLRKDAGALHSADGFTNVTNVILKDKTWTTNGDTHTMEFAFADDAVYQIHVSAKDLAGNDAESRTSAIFEIDKTAPVIVARDSVAVKADNVEFVDIYPYTREKDPAPTIEFDDINFAYLRYNLTKYSPKEDALGATKMDPVTVFAPEDEKQNGKINNKIFTLPDFVEDGVYALEITAVDDAGNESLLNNNTYIRIVEHDVIAYIMDSNIAAGTGLYSFQYENGDAISKRPDNFMDLRICVITALESQAEVVLRDTNGKEYPTNAKARTNSSIYGVQEYYFDVNSSFFKETFQDDTDIELFLTVKNEENRIDLGKMHIDNIAPECEMPKGFKPWHWYYGKEDRTITLTGINELLDVEACKVFDNGRPIEFNYSAENSTLEFTIDKGWHTIGLVLTDVAGNSYNIQELRNIHVGFFWLWIIISASVLAVAAGATGTVFFIRKRSQDIF